MKLIDSTLFFKILAIKAILKYSVTILHYSTKTQKYLYQLHLDVKIAL